MSDIAVRRRFYAEEVQAVANIRSAAIVDALASVERERFLPPGPWTVRSEADMGQPPRQTNDADPKHVYHNFAVAIAPERMLFNGAPSLIAMAIDTLAPAPGIRVLHVGAGTGYYTAVIAHCVGSTGRVVAVEIDPELSGLAARNLANLPQVEVRTGDGTLADGERFDAILVNAGVTHPLDAWLDALAPGGRMILPLTASFGAPGNIGKGLLLLIARDEDGVGLRVRTVTFVAIYSAQGIRDQALNTEIGKALQKNPFPPLTTLLRTPHERTDACWLHAERFCFATRP